MRNRRARKPLIADEVREISAEEFRQHTWSEMSERTWGLRLERIAREHGWEYFHTFDSRHSAGGYPDYHLIRGGDEFYTELKTMTGKMSAKQEKWKRLLEGAGNEWHLLRPCHEDWLIDRLNRPYVPEVTDGTETDR
jgi:hypothetical protein